MISKKLFTGGINADDADILIDSKEYLNALNIRFATTENGKVGQLSNIEGNTLRTTTLGQGGGTTVWSLPAGTNTTIGAIEDTPNRRIFFFNKNSNGDDGIYCYDADTLLIYNVLLSSQVVGGLSFSTNIHSVAIIDNLLYWTDGIKPQRRINVEAGIKLNHPTYSTSVSPYVLDQQSNTKMLASVISLIRNQPAVPLTVAKANQAGYASNFISTEAFQFAYRFVYRDYEVSTFSPLSNLANYHSADDTVAGYNRIDVTIPTTQKIPQDVIRVEVAVKYVVGGKYFIVKTFTSGFSTHNTGTALTFKFFNDSVGIAVDDVSAFKQYDAIPIKSSTLEIAKNRLFLGNNYDGYETPASSSLATSVTTSSAGSLTGSWFKVSYNGTDKYVINITGVEASKSGYYYIIGATTPLPGTYDFASMNYAAYPTGSYLGSDELGVFNKLYGISPPFNPQPSFTFQSYVTITNGPALTSLAGKTAFKSDSSYRLGVVFYDEAGRKCGVVTSDATNVVTSDRTYSNISYTTNINWTLTNSTNASVLQAEIPDWAYYYSIVMTKCLRTNFFMQMRASDVQYATKAADGTYTFNTSYLETKYGIAVKIDGLNKYGMGYSFQEGDILKLYGSDNSKRYLKIKDTYSDYVIVDMANLGTIVQYLYEIYTPYTQSTNEVYYEKGVVYPVTNPTASNRSYSTITGSFTGDITILERTLSSNTFIAETMSPNDLKWKDWNTNIGRGNIVLDTKPANKKTSVCFSNVIVLGSQTNGLSTFDTLDQTQLPYELSSIQKLKLVSKVEAEGTVMLAIGEQETASMYLGESQVFDNTGASFLAKSSGVIGNVNVMRGSFGTINPESVVRYMGNVYWFDANKGSVVSYSANGLFPISSNKMQKYFRKVGEDVLTKGLKFYGGIDPYHNEVLMFAPRKSVIPEGPRLTDMTNGAASYSFTTTSSASTISVVGTPDYSYNGGQLGPNQATVTGSTGAVTFTYSGTGGTTYGPSSTRPSQVGTYQVIATVASDGVYDAATSAPFAFSIATAFVFDADYMLLTYQFTNGTDLDTRTRIVTPNIGQTSQSTYIGYGRPSVWPSTGTPILTWGDDNRGTGFESVLINVAQLKSAYPSATSLVADLRAFWWGTVGTNPVNVAAKLWKGGSPIKQGEFGSPAFSFTNPTATATLDIASVGTQITLQTNDVGTSGSRVATLTYNLTNNTGSFNSNDTTTPSV